MGKVVTNPETINSIKALRRAGVAYRSISKRLGISEKTAKKYGQGVHCPRRKRNLHSIRTDLRIDDPDLL